MYTFFFLWLFFQLFFTIQAVLRYFFGFFRSFKSPELKTHNLLTYSIFLFSDFSVAPTRYYIITYAVCLPIHAYLFIMYVF